MALIDNLNIQSYRQIISEIGFSKLSGTTLPQFLFSDYWGERILPFDIFETSSSSELELESELESIEQIAGGWNVWWKQFRQK